MVWKENKYIKKVRGIEDICITCVEDREYEGSGTKGTSTTDSEEP